MHVIEVDPCEAFRAENLLQSPFWAHFKQRLGHRTWALRFENEGAAGSLVAVERSAGSGAEHLYIPHGPELAPDEGEQAPFLLDLSGAIAGAVGTQPVFLRYDLPWASPYLEDGLWHGRPDSRIQEMRMNFGTGRKGLRKAPTDIQPPDTVIVQLRADDRTLLSRMKPKTRYNIRLAARHGVVVGDEGIEALCDWHRLYRQTCARQRIVSEGPGYFRGLFETAEKEHVENHGRSPEVRLIAGRHEGIMVAGLVCAFWGDKAYYLYGASSRAHGRLMATYAVQWHTMLAARAAGCRTYDMFGVPPTDDPAHPLHGLYRFKTGFGGQVHHFRGCWDVPIREREYRSHAHVSASSGAYHLRI